MKKKILSFIVLVVFALPLIAMAEITLPLAPMDEAKAPAPIEGLVKIKGKIRDMSTQADNYQLKIKDEAALLWMTPKPNDKFYVCFEDTDGNIYNGQGHVGANAFWIICECPDCGLIMVATGKTKVKPSGALLLKGKAFVAVIGGHNSNKVEEVGNVNFKMKF